MKAEELVRAGDVDGALAELQQRVRSKPANVELRIFLFQLMAVLGQWKRALNQLSVIKDLDTDTWPMVHAYREAINCEMHRAAVFEGKSKPLVFGEPQEWIAVLIEAQQACARGDLENFQKLNARALEAAPATAGKIDGEPFEWLADADQRFGPVIEVIFNSQYYWAPLHTIKNMRSENPTDLRDLIWVPTEVTWANGGQNMVMIPARYPRLSGVSNDDLLGRKTDWLDGGHDFAEGIGQRLLATDQADYPLLQVRSIEVESD
jgi:type VI secretion system protein ImpE